MTAERERDSHDDMNVSQGSFPIRSVFFGF